MLHEFSISLPQRIIDSTMEKLNLHGLFNLYYEQPIEQYEEENGYGFLEVKETEVALNIYFEEIQGEPFNIEEKREELASILQVRADRIRYQFLDTTDWQEPFPVVDLENGWVIKPPNAEAVVTDHLIVFEPPRAFGSGLHGTTQDCLRNILREDLRNQKVLDLGAGAGLLSVAAALVGSEKVIAVEIEDVKEEIRFNAQLNGVQKAITVIHADALSASFKLDEVFNWILVNIAANEIKSLYPFIDAHLVNDGKLLLSGMVEWNYQETLDHYTKNGYTLNELSRSEEWVTALLSKTQK